MEINSKIQPINTKQLVLQLIKKDENRFCADCKSVSPSWANIKLGVLICINCSLFHRELNSNISQLKSIYLDTWPLEMLKNFIIINNKISNNYWEYNLNNFNYKNIIYDGIKLKEFIRNKYELQKWIKPGEINPLTKIIKLNNFEKIRKKNINILFQNSSMISLLKKENLNENKLNKNINIYNNHRFSNFQNQGDNNISSFISYYDNNNNFYNNKEINIINYNNDNLSSMPYYKLKNITIYKEKNDSKEREGMQLLQEKKEKREKKAKLKRERRELKKQLKEQKKKEKKEIARLLKERKHLLKEKNKEKEIQVKIQDKYETIKNYLPVPFNIDQIQLEKLKNSDKNECMICLEEFIINEHVLYLPCSHLFHFECILSWLLKKDNCPICLVDYRKKIKEEEKKRIPNRINIVNPLLNNERKNNNQFLFENENIDFYNGYQSIDHIKNKRREDNLFCNNFYINRKGENHFFERNTREEINRIEAFEKK